MALKSLGLAFAALAAVSMAACNQSSSPPATKPAVVGVVTGGIDPCEGNASANGPRYAAGTVTVLKGHIRQRRIEPGTYAMVFPTNVIARMSVGTNATFSFQLVPGRYILRARYLVGNALPWMHVRVRRRQVLRADIPNMCM